MSNQKQSFWMSPKGFASMGLIASVTYFLLMEHRGSFQPSCPKYCV
jgi:hypothetical protein